ncbi:MAG TPA: sugar-binding domain-containing protein [Limnochordia bacterium]|nr:sugar-binding domain-containing protein [Limnochordia bacterium]
MLNYNDEQDLDLLVRISEMYYIQGKAQKEISEALNLSRSGVSRLLHAARERDIVQFTVRNPSQRLHQLGQAVKEEFGLAECRLSPVELTYDALQLRLAYQAAECLLSLLNSGSIIGVGFSSTVHKMVELLPNSHDYACLKFVPISGGTGVTRGPHINYTVQLAASKFGADYVSLNVPLFIDEPSIVAKLFAEKSIKQCTDFWSQLSCAVIGIGATNRAVPEGLRVPSPHTPTTAAVCGWFFDEHGQVVEDKSTAAISIKQLQDTPKVVAVAGGTHSTAAILAVLRAGFVTHLVTDEEVARDILHLNQQ